MSTILTSEQVTKRFGGLTAVNTFDFKVPEHSIVSIIGPNGAKNYLLQLCHRFLQF